jgi:acyl-CoA synthetase (AMP-forming)/AMP-acid ligase II
MGYDPDPIGAPTTDRAHGAHRESTTSPALRMGADVAAPTSTEPTTLPQAIARAAARFPDAGIGVFDGRGRRAERRTYADLHRLATATAARFAALGVAEREPVLVVLPTSWEWMAAWFGAVVRGAWPVAMAAPGGMAAAEIQLDKVERVMERIGARRLVASAAFREQCRAGGYELAAAGAVTPEELADVDPARGFAAPTADADEVAFLQLTSGSTGLPRAVMIPHRAAIHNPLASSRAIGAPHGAPVEAWADAMVSWLPLYHDMGLIGCLMLPLLTGLDTWLLRPTTFLARPRLWLQSLAARGTTFVPAPNFAYQLCVERIGENELDGVDLSGWRAALTGAEMVRPETTTAFCRAFAGNGFAPEAFRPCYGLAEATLAVTFDTRGEGVRTLPAPAGADVGFGLSEVVSTGVPIDDTAVGIVAPDGSALPEDTIGEVRIAGPGICSGYYRDPEATAEALRDGWFYTGDLGFLHDGELYLTGRTKDLIIVRGQNLMPDDLERLADGVTGGGGLLRSAAFSVARGRGGEEAVLVVETTDTEPSSLADLEQAIRTRIGRALALPLADVAFVRRGRIPRTTSGKMQRNEVRQRYLDGSLERIERG